MLTMTDFFLKSHHTFLCYCLSLLFLVLSLPLWEVPVPVFSMNSLTPVEDCTWFPLSLLLQAEGSHWLQPLFAHPCIWQQLGLMQRCWQKGKNWSLSTGSSRTPLTTMDQLHPNGVGTSSAKRAELLKQRTGRSHWWAVPACRCLWANFFHGQ